MSRARARSWSRTTRPSPQWRLSRTLPVVWLKTRTGWSGAGSSRPSPRTATSAMKVYDTHPNEKQTGDSHFPVAWASAF